MVEKKRIIFIRHAQSQAQAYGQAHGNKGRSTAAHLRDCALSPEGMRAIEKLNVPLDHIQLVVVSPMTRALQTACVAFRNHKQTPMIAHPALCEFAAHKRMRGVENTGRSHDEVRLDPVFASLHRFTDIDFRIVQERERQDSNWWDLDEQGIDTNMDTITKWLADRPETCIAVVGHCNNTMRLMNTRYLVPNAVPIEATLSMQKGKWALARRDRALTGHVAYVARRQSLIAQQSLMRLASQQSIKKIDIQALQEEEGDDVDVEAKPLKETDGRRSPSQKKQKRKGGGGGVFCCASSVTSVQTEEINIQPRGQNEKPPDSPPREAW